MTVDPAVLKVADAVGALMEAWGFRRNMGRMWAVLYLEDHPLTAADLGERLGLSTGSVSMLINELAHWEIIRKTWVVGERREHFEAETSIWKMVSRVFRERELRWIRTAHEAFAAAGKELAAGDDERHALIAGRIAGLSQLAEVGAHLLETMLEGAAIDSLPIKTVGELARAAQRGPGAEAAAATDRSGPRSDGLPSGASGLGELGEPATGPPSDPDDRT